MGRIRYAKSQRDLERATESGDAPLESEVQSIRCVYETDAEAAQAVVPKPLEATVQPEVIVQFGLVSMQLAPDARVSIRSACFGVRVEYDGVPGSYPLTMPMSAEAAVVAGRERFGEPKKLAEIDFEVDHAKGAVSASVTRMGIRYLSVIGQRVEALTPSTPTEHAYCFKAFPSCDARKGFDQDPQLVRLEWQHRHDLRWRLTGGLELVDSPFDPVADLPVRRVVELEYTEGTTRSAGRVLRPVPGDWLLPFMHQRYDDPRIEGIDV